MKLLIYLAPGSVLMIGAALALVYAMHGGHRALLLVGALAGLAALVWFWLQRHLFTSTKRAAAHHSSHR